MKGLGSLLKGGRVLTGITTEAELRAGPTIRRHKSEQSVATPWEFIKAVEDKFGRLVWDLAADITNAKAPLFINEAQDSFTVDWHRLHEDADAVGPLLWLNPPFANITPWARKCAEESQLGAEILLLVPGSIGANWYWDWVEPFADVYSVGRMVFENCYDKEGNLITTPYPKDLILAHYNDERRSYRKLGLRMQRWDWKNQLLRN